MRERFVVAPGKRVDLRKINTDSTPGFREKSEADEVLARNVERLAKLQYLLYAEGRRALLVILQAMDAAGKDGTIRHVMSGLNPQSCRVTSFKAPTDEELSHDFLWRVHRAVPARGEIGIFNRSHYEDVLIVRVKDLVPKSAWSKRYEQINAFERILAANGVTILKFFLHVSKDEQRARLVERLENPKKNWKVNPADFEERKRWDDYVRAYEDALAKCSTAEAPWFVIPSDHKWFRNLAVSQIIVETLKSMNMKFPKAQHDLSKIQVE
jgi:PPK2 family polyphosphate:nucleotide phosphotransferase